MARRNPKRRKRSKHLRSKIRLFSIGGLALLFLLVGAGFVLLKPSEPEGSTVGSAPDEINAASAWDAQVRAATERIRHFKGDPNAPVTILEFSDFQ